MEESPDNPVRKGRAGWWVPSAFCLIALVGVGAWWVYGKRVWTDDRTIHSRASDSAVREVLWTKPQPPSDLFNTDGEEYEPSVSADGNELFFVRGKPGHNAEIFVSRREHGRWTAPRPLEGINSPYDDLGPRL